MIRALLLILLIQCGIATAVYWPQDTRSAANPAAPLLASDPAQVVEILITDEAGNAVQLRRQGEQWQLPALAGLAADPAQVEKLLATLTTGQHGFPVATSVPAKQRLQVADYRYQRSIRLTTANGEHDTALLGTAPAYRQVHARREGDDAIYSIPLSVFDAPTSSASWLDSGLLQVTAPQRIAGDGFQLQQDANAGWQTIAGQTPEPRELEALLVGLANLQVDGVADDNQLAQLGTRAADFSITATLAEGARALAFYQWAGDHFVRDARFTLFFTISAYDYDRLHTLDVARLNGGP